MDIDILDRFLYSSAKKCYSVIISSLVILFLIVYYFFITPINDQYQREQLNYVALLDDLNLLELKIAKYPSNKQLLSNITDLKELTQDNKIIPVNTLTEFISQQLLNNRLKLIDFDRQDEKIQTKLFFKITGDYQKFVEFILQLSNQYLNITIAYISVYLQADNLIFLLQITLEHQSGQSQ